MFGKIAIGTAAAVAALVPSAALGVSSTYNLRLIIPVHCTVNHDSTGFGAMNGEALSLGTFREYCNAPSGYQIVVRYAPGSLQGARILAGNDEVVLDGSGYSILSQTTGPRIRERLISMAPGVAEAVSRTTAIAAGFITDSSSAMGAARHWLEGSASVFGLRARRSKCDTQANARSKNRPCICHAGSQT